MANSTIAPYANVENRVNLSQAVPLDTPFTLNIGPSGLCNFRCCYCGYSLGLEKATKEYGIPQRLMSIDTIKLIAEQSKEFKHKYKHICFAGFGEPLCNKNVPVMIDILKKADISEQIDIITNASLLTRDMSDRLIDSGLDVLKISLQGISAESYKTTSNVDIDFDKFRDNIRYFYQKSRGKCKVFVKTMNISLKEGEEKLFYDMFGDISDRMHITKVAPLFDELDNSMIEQNVSSNIYGLNTDSKHIIVCPMPFYIIGVWADGSVYCCDSVYKFGYLGNVHNKRLTDMWNGEEHKQFCLLQLNGGRFNDNCCKKCQYPEGVTCKEDLLDENRFELIEKIVNFGKE